MNKINEFGFPDEGRWRFHYWSENETVLADWIVDFKNKTITELNMYTDSFMEKPFGDIADPSFADFYWFMNRRVWGDNYDGLSEEYDRYQCHPRTRFNLLLNVNGRIASDEYSLSWEALYD